MAEILSDQAKIELAKTAAKTMFATLATIPHEIQLEAAIVLMRTLFITNVKPTHRIILFNSVVQKIRKEIQHHLKTGAIP